MHQNAVIVRAGRHSTHASWVTGAKPQFDLIVAGYEQLGEPLVDAATVYVHLPGTKVGGWAALFGQRPDILDRYERIAFLDDDLVCTAGEINQTFDIGRDHGLALWQPSLTPDSYFSYALFQQNRLFKLRYVNFIEMMCPFFSIAYLKTCLPLFQLGYETGIDRVWSRLQAAKAGSFAVIDSVAVHHSRPVGQNKARQGFVGANDTYDTVVDQLEARFGIRYRGAIPFGGITRSGRRLDGRAAMAMMALWPLTHWPQARQGKYARRFSILVRHILTRWAETARMPPIDLAPALLEPQDAVRSD